MIAIILLIISIILHKFELSSDKRSSSLAAELSQKNYVPSSPLLFSREGLIAFKKERIRKK